MTRLMMKTRRRFRDGKRIDPRPRKQRGDKPMDVQCGQPLPNILQLNVEGLNASKICVISRLATKHKALIILLQETHCTSVDRLVIPNFTLAGHTQSRKHGFATFVHSRLKWNLVDQSPTGSAIEWLCVDIDGVKVINVYKPPTSRLTPTAIPVFPHPSIYAGDFNYQHTNWGYNSTSPDGECLTDWATKSTLVLLHNPKDAPSFFSGRWNTGTNPDLVFASTGHNSCHLDKRVLEKFPRSQHRPSLITTPRTIFPVPSEPYKRWNFRKANWELYSLTANKLAQEPSTTKYELCLRGLPGLLQRHRSKPPSDQSHAVVEIIIDLAGMRSVRASTRTF